MLTMTEAAGAHISHLLGEARFTGEVAMHLVPGDEGMRLLLDRPQPRDIRLEHEGKTVLVLNEGAAELVEDASLNVRDTEDGPKLVLQAK